MNEPARSPRAAGRAAPRRASPAPAARPTVALSGLAAPPVAVVLLLLAAVPVARAQDGAAATTLDGVFTAEQAERGRELYADACARCHPTSRFTGEAFRPSWSRAPASTLFTVVRSQMPFDNPGSLGRDEYAAILAYLFQLNDLPAGDARLPASADSLRGLTIRFPPSAAADSGG